MSKFILTLAAVGILVTAAESVAEIVVIDTSQLTQVEFEYEGADGHDSDSDQDFSGSATPFDSDLLVSLEASDAYLEARSAMMATFETTGFDVSVSTIAEVQILDDTVTVDSTGARSEFFVLFTVDVESIYEVTGNLYAVLGSAGHAEYALTRTDVFGTVTRSTAGDHPEGFGDFPVDEMGVIPPGTYRFVAFSNAHHNGDTGVNMVLDITPTNVPVQPTSWSAVKEEFGE